MDLAGRGPRLLRLRLPVRAAGFATAGHLSGARDLRARGGDAAAAQGELPRGLDRRRAGHQPDQARRPVLGEHHRGLGGRPAAQFRPVALLLHRRGRGRALRLRRQPGEESHRPCADRDPRSSDRRECHGHQRCALQVADLRRERALHRRRRCARRDRHRVRGAGQLHLHARDRAIRRPGGGRRRLYSRDTVRRLLRAVRAQYRRGWPAGSP